MAKIKLDIELKSGEGVYSVDSSRIDNLTSLSQSNASPDKIFYGVLPNTGSVDIADINGEIKSLVEDDVLDYSGVNVDLSVNGKQFQSHITGDSDYKDNLLTLSLTDDLSNTSQSVYVNKEWSNYLSDLDAYGVLGEICLKSLPALKLPSSSSNYLPYNELNLLNMYEYLRFIKFKDIDMSLNTTNTQEALNSFCNATQINITSGVEKQTLMLNSRPCFGVELDDSLESSPIFIRLKDIFEDGASSLFRKNRIKQVNIHYNNIEEQTISLPQIKNSDSPEGDLNTYLDNRSLYSSGLISMDSLKENRIEEFTDSSGRTWLIRVHDVTDSNYYQVKSAMSCHVLVDDSYYYLDYLHPKAYTSIDLFKEELTASSINFVAGFYKTPIFSKYSKLSIIYAFVKDDTTNNFRFWIGSFRDGFSSVTYSIKKKTESIYTLYGEESNDKASEVFEVPLNPLLTSTSTISVYGKDVPLYEYIAMNILNDYSDGIRTKNLQIACSNLYFTKYPSLVARNWGIGEILKIGDIVNVETEKYKNGEYINWKVTGREFVIDGAPILNLELQECRREIKLYNYLSSITWSRISEISKSGKAKDYFNVGDEKYIPEIGATMVILGFNHDYITNGSSAGITFGLKYNSIANGARCYIDWNENNSGTPYNSNINGWKNSYVRNYLNGTFFEQLPDDLKNSIVAVNKVTGIGGGSNSTSITSDKIWIPSEVEMSGVSTYGASGEGRQYTYFGSYPSDSVKAYWKNYFGPLRSPNVSNTSSMIQDPSSGASVPSSSTNSYLFVNGIIGATSPSYEFDQIICFCI